MQHILVIEDDAGVRSMLLDALESQGFEVTAAENMAGARGALKRGGIDLIISDFILAQDAGLTATEEAQARNMPLLIMTGHPERKQEFEEAGVDFLAKPFKLAELARQIKAAFARGAPRSRGVIPDCP